MAVAYVGRLGMQCHWTVRDKDMFLVSVSIFQTLRAIVRDILARCDSRMTTKAQWSFYADRHSADGQVLPDAYRSVVMYLSWIDDFKVFLPVETQRVMSAAPMEIDSPVAVDWKHFERATKHAWRWLIKEITSVARIEGYHKFLERQRPEVGFICHDMLYFIGLNIV